jgi:hypothetical protein
MSCQRDDANVCSLRARHGAPRLFLFSLSGIIEGDEAVFIGEGKRPAKRIEVWVADGGVDRIQREMKRLA